MAFEYFISHRNSIAVISFAGDLDLASLPKLDECRLQIENLPIRHLVFNMVEVKKITEETLRPLTMIQNSARKHNLSFRVCGLSEEYFEFLVSKGVVKRSEVHDDLLEGLKSLDLHEAA